MPRCLSSPRWGAPACLTNLTTAVPHRGPISAANRAPTPTPTLNPTPGRAPHLLVKAQLGHRLGEAQDGQQRARRDVAAAVHVVALALAQRAVVRDHIVRQLGGDKRLLPPREADVRAQQLGCHQVAYALVLGGGVKGATGNVCGAGPPGQQ